MAMHISTPKVLGWLGPHPMMKNSISWEVSGNLMAEPKPLLARMAKERGTSSITLHTSKLTQSMGNCRLLTLNRELNLRKVGLNSAARVKRCKPTAVRAMSYIIRIRRRRKSVWKTTKGARTGATWHHKSHYHSKENLLLPKNLETGRLSQFKSKFL